jgi:S1-C subfamily serine protease
MARLSLLHLSGPRRGEVDPLHRLPASIGSSPEDDVVVPGVAAHHLVLVERGDEIVLRDGGSGEPTYLAGEAVTEGVLRDGDVVELGSDGLQLRFRREDAGHVSFLQALRWARPKGLRLGDTAGFMRAVARETAIRTSRAFRLAVVGLLAILVLLLFFSQREASRVQRELADVREAMRTAEAQRRELERRVEEERQRAEADRRGFEAQVAEFRQREEALTRRLAEATSGEVKGLREELHVARTRLATLEEERAVGERIIREYGGGVGLIQGSFAIFDAAGQPLRYRLGEDGRPLVQPDGSPVLDAKGDGPVHTVEYFGTGFLVDARGVIVTNRHVAEPWWQDEGVQALVAAGHSPRFETFRLFFPRQKDAFQAKVLKVSETTDLALLQVDVKNRKIPVLPLDTEGRGAVAGQPVVLIGYPTGLEAILAKADANLVREILSTYGTDSRAVTEGLSQKGLIRPSTTQGHIGDITKTDIVFDAATTQGGSGGPVFNKYGRVVAVEYAVHARFAGNAFGVPVRHAVELLRSQRKRKPAAD